MAVNNTSIDTTTYSLRLTDVADEPRQLLLPIEGYEEMPLVTLEEAIKPISHFFHEIHTKVYIAKYNCELVKDPITHDAAASIMLYTMGKSANDQALYYVLNSILRSNQPDRSDQLKPWFLYLKLFITALSYIPSYRGTIYRGVKLDLSDYYPVGREFVWWGFSSCTKSLSVLQSELFLGKEGVGTLFVIDCFSGKEIRDYSYFQKEDEVLLVAARQFRVTGSLNPKPHLWIIQIKEIEPPFPFLKVDHSISSTLERSVSQKTKDICSQCSKKFSYISMLDAETDTDDSPWNDKSDKEDGSQLNENDDQSTDVIPKLTNSEAGSQAPGGMSTAASFAVITPSNLDALASVEVNKDPANVRTMSYKNKLITEKSVQSIVEDIRRNPALEILYFCNNGLKDAALHHLIQAITDRTGLKVFIDENSITDESAKILANVLTKSPQAIVQLNLQKNRLTSQGVKTIAQALTTATDSGLKALSFCGNRSIDDECIDDIIHLCEQNQRLRSLYLDKCNLSNEGKQRLQTALLGKKALFLQV